MDSNITALKYPRRTRKTIDGRTYNISEPSVNASKTMQNVRSSDTSIEKMLEDALVKAGVYFTKPENLIEKIDGSPDFIIPKQQIAIFCDGDFWHGHNAEQQNFNTNREFWVAKIKRNIQRDGEVSEALKHKGWRVLRFWEHELKKDMEGCMERILREMQDDAGNELFTFVDLFSGIGGFRIPLEQLGGKCLGFSEIDKPAVDVYKQNFLGSKSCEEVELGSVTNIKQLPFNNVDLIVGGVPCQSWSVAGKMRGFEDPRGKLWNDSIRIVRLNRPKAFIFENVKGLYDPRNKENLDFLKNSFNELGYEVKAQLMNSYDFGLPQNRDRIFLVGIRRDIENVKEYAFPKPIEKKSFLYDMISGVDFKGHVKTQFDPKELFGEKIPMGRNRFQKINELNDFFIFCDTRNGHTTIHSWDLIKTTAREKKICMVILRNRRKKIYGSSDGNPMNYDDLKGLIPDLEIKELEKLITKKILRMVDGRGYAFVNSKNSAGVNGIYRIYLPHSNIFSTLTATGTKDYVALKSITADSPAKYKEKFLEEIVKAKAFRKITAKEAGKLQGFPAHFTIHANEMIAKKQFGNAVSTSVVYHVAKELVATNVFDNE